MFGADVDRGPAAVAEVLAERGVPATRPVRLAEDAAERVRKLMERPRQGAEQALRTIVAAGHAAEVRAAADRCGPPARTAIEELLAVEPTELLAVLA
ncbi:hypothetical protein ACIP95_18790 [Micromonospora parva]|uniref:hypothetical protein n=2 Tax=Micromonospora TaxID=1873 RepID=UPI000B3371BF|nr:hypothetical protein [Micromonospora parva]